MKQVLPLWDERRRCGCGGEFVALGVTGETDNGIQYVMDFRVNNYPDSVAIEEGNRWPSAAVLDVYCQECGAKYGFQIPLIPTPRDPKKWWWQR